MTPIVSIIIPVYNAEKYLSECIESILNQTMQNWELILVDDGSKDNSSKICRYYSDKDSRILFLEQKNSGSSVARNKGIERSCGKYISFVDADDWVSPNMYEKLVECADLECADIVICNHYRVYAGNKSILQPKSGYGKWVFEGRKDIDVYLRKYLCKGIKEYRPYLKMGQPWGRIYLREMLISNNVLFPEGLARTEDGIFNMYAAQVANKIIFLDTGYYYYRIIPNSISHRYYKDIVKNTERDFLEVKKFADKYKRNDDIFMKGIDVRIVTWFYKYLSCFYFTDEYIKEHGYLEAKKEIKKVKNMNLYRDAYSRVELKYLTIFERAFVMCMKYNLLDIAFIVVRIREKKNGN